MAWSTRHSLPGGCIPKGFYRGIPGCQSSQTAFETCQEAAQGAAIDKRKGKKKLLRRSLCPVAVQIILWQKLSGPTTAATGWLILPLSWYPARTSAAVHREALTPVSVHNNAARVSSRCTPANACIPGLRSGRFFSRYTTTGSRTA